MTDDRVVKFAMDRTPQEIWQMNEALKRCERLFDEALPKFNWGKSALDANAIALLNEVPNEVRQAIK